MILSKKKPSYTKAGESYNSTLLKQIDNNAVDVPPTEFQVHAHRCTSIYFLLALHTKPNVSLVKLTKCTLLILAVYKVIFIITNLKMITIYSP
jgi:hypothetical protein